MQYLSTLTILTLFSSAQAVLDIVQPTGQCTDQHAVGQFWTCASGVFGCQWKGADAPCNRPNDDVNIGRQFCDVSKGETIVIGQGQGSKSIGGDKCYSSYVWVMADYTWQCCQCPAGYQPAGQYSVRQDGVGSFTYDRTITGGSVEKTCMRCTGAGEKLTYDYAKYEWSCQSGTSTTTSSSQMSSTTTSSSTTNGGTIVIPRTTTTTTTSTTTTTTTKTTTKPTTTSSKTTTTTTKKTTTATPTTLKTSTKSSTTTTKK